ncbi:hypothetical protein [Mycolicibacterium sp. YH-1]|uniref:hypothetical protein n=1 Tax=Mycolicibacterium sp. YH-1 TaxID=2908837 RepID=UPI001F4C2AAC|nr:hypothetical protein [Mycolicibacterium sp. YH-1]UNB54596.1 hypothetical protein L0M16_09880 [Mycolicibacterium sp. YH-1]
MSPHRQGPSAAGLTGMGPGEQRKLVAWISTVAIGAGYASATRLASALSDLEGWNFRDFRDDEALADFYARYAYSRARDEINAVLRRHGCRRITPIVEHCARVHLSDAVVPAVWNSAFTNPSEKDLDQNICAGLDAATLNLAAQLTQLLNTDDHKPTLMCDL